VLSNFVGDGPGIVLFLIWLVLPPVYMVVIGRRYAQQCAESAYEAVWAREELRQVLDDLRAAPEPDEPVTVPLARQYRAEPSAPSGRHRLRTDRSVPLARTGT